MTRLSHGCSSLMWWKNWLITRLGCLVTVAGTRKAETCFKCSRHVMNLVFGERVN